jgi:endonuclease YncB( thermonuclease family)
MGNTRIRIEGMDAPERDQLCGDENLQNNPCGTKATEALREIVGDKSVDCAASGLDRYGRSLATYTVDGLDIEHERVRDCWALAFVRYSKRYIEDEDAARTIKAGMWGGTFIEPRNYGRGRN